MSSKPLFDPQRNHHCDPAHFDHVGAIGSTSSIATLVGPSMYAAKSITSCSAWWRNDAGYSAERDTMPRITG